MIKQGAAARIAELAGKDHFGVLFDLLIRAAVSDSVAPPVTIPAKLAFIPSHLAALLNNFTHFIRKAIVVHTVHNNETNRNDADGFLIARLEIHILGEAGNLVRLGS